MENKGMVAEQARVSGVTSSDFHDDLRSGLGFRLSRAARLLRSRWSRALEDLRLTPTHAALLRALAERPDQGVRDLARMLSTDPTSVKHHLDALEARRLVVSPSSVRKGDRRPFQLTSEGTVIVSTVQDRLAAQTQFLEGALGVDGQQALAAALDCLEAALLGDN